MKSKLSVKTPQIDLLCTIINLELTSPFIHWANKTYGCTSESYHNVWRTQRGGDDPVMKFARWPWASHAVSQPNVPYRIISRMGAGACYKAQRTHCYHSTFYVQFKSSIQAQNRLVPEGSPPPTLMCIKRIRREQSLEAKLGGCLSGEHQGVDLWGSDSTGMELPLLKYSLSFKSAWRQSF